MKEIVGFEISFDEVIEENEVIRLFGILLDVPTYQFWNWDWSGSPSHPIVANVTYQRLEKQNGILVTFLFNGFQTVGDLFELDAGIFFSNELMCKAIVPDPSSAEIFLRIYPDGSIDRCIEHHDEQGNSVYDVTVEKGISYDEIRSKYYSNRQI